MLLVLNSSNGGARMHPVWVQKIEDARRKSVMMFWGTMFFVVVLPILLMMKADFFMVLAILCFGAAGVRVYRAAAQPQAVLRSPGAGTGEGMPVSRPVMPVPNQAVTIQPGMQAQTMQMHMSGQEMRQQPLMEPTQETQVYGVVTGRQIAQQNSGQNVAEGFFKVSVDPGQPLIPQGVLPEAVLPQVEPPAPEVSEPAPNEVVEVEPVFASMHFHDIALGRRTPPAVAPEELQQ